VWGERLWICRLLCLGEMCAVLGYCVCGDRCGVETYCVWERCVDL